VPQQVVDFTFAAEEQVVFIRFERSETGERVGARQGRLPSAA
jgi:hypothetical protein